MKLTLLDYVGSGFDDPYHAADLLIFTKQTRVKMSPNAMDEIRSWPKEKKLDELGYIANTIPGSWEMVSYVFLIENVTRALTHQLVRTRTASYAMQTQQVLDVSGFGYETGPSIEADPDLTQEYQEHMKRTDEVYRNLISKGAKIEDARGVLPTNIYTNIIMKANLRTYIDLFHSRIGPRNYGSMSQMCRIMRDKIMEVHPWTSVFMNRNLDQALEELDLRIKNLPMDDNVAGEKFKLLKLIDQVRRKS
jgi:flavin-dependent thymidylate synthase